MDEDTKFVLQMWRVQVMENHRLAGVSDHLQRRVDALERELGYTYVRERTDAGGAVLGDGARNATTVGIIVNAAYPYTWL
jgi:hypothetical protein